MKDRDFDRLLRQKLQDIQPPFQPENWEQLESRLDHVEAGKPEREDWQLDEELFQKLHRVEAPYSSEAWEAMEARLEREFIRTEYLYRYKLSELLLMFLLLLTLQQVLTVPADAPDTDPLATQNQKQKAITEGSGMHSLREALTTPFNEDPSPASLKGNEGSTPGDQTPSLHSAAPAPLAFVGPSSEERQNAGRRPAEAASLTPPLATPLLAIARQRDRLKSSPQNAAPSRPSYPGLKSEVLAPLAFRSSVASFPTAAEEGSILPNTESEEGRFLNFGMFGSTEFNQVVTPSDRIKNQNIPALQRFEFGYGGGLSVGFEMGRWELQTGAIYSAKEYRPSPVEFKRGVFERGYILESLTRIELNVLNVPLNLRYNIIHQKNWRFYALAGASVQVAFQANYYRQWRLPARSAEPVITDPDALGVSPLEERGLTPGWFEEDGTFGDNGYLTGNLGLGLERNLNTRWSLFAQPTYQHSITFFNSDQGFGPKRDQINTLSVYTGLRVRLKR